MKLNQKGAIDMMFVVLLVVVLGIGGFVAYRITETDKDVNDSSVATEAASNSTVQEEDGADPIENVDEEAKVAIREGWVEYRNEGSGFSLYHPKDWTVESEESNSLSVVLAEPEGPNKTSVRYTTNKESSCKATDSDLTDLVVDGKEAQQFTGGLQSLTIITCVDSGPTTYHIEHSYPAKNGVASTEDYNSLLATFTLLNVTE